MFGLKLMGGVPVLVVSISASVEMGRSYSVRGGLLLMGTAVRFI